MAHINQNYLKLPGSYLFSEVNRRITACEVLFRLSEFGNTELPQSQILLQ